MTARGAFSCSKDHLGAQWRSGTIAQPAIAPRQAPAQDPLVPVSNPTCSSPSKGRTSFTFSHYRLPDHVSIIPTNTVASFPNSDTLSQHQQAITESPAVTSHSPVTEPGQPPPALPTGRRRPEWCPKKWPRAMDKSPGCNEALTCRCKSRQG